MNGSPSLENRRAKFWKQKMVLNNDDGLHNSAARSESGVVY
jgi:hypothetical protein